MLSFSFLIFFCWGVGIDYQGVGLLLEDCNQFSFTCVAMLIFDMVQALSPFICFASNICLKIRNDRFGLSLKLLVKSTHTTKLICNLLPMMLTNFSVLPTYSTYTTNSAKDSVLKAIRLIFGSQSKFDLDLDKYGQNKHIVQKTGIIFE